MGEGCIDGVIRPADLRFVADGSGREYTVLSADVGSPHLDLRPYAGRHLTICGPVDPQFRIHNGRILPYPALLKPLPVSLTPRDSIPGFR